MKKLKFFTFLLFIFSLLKCTQKEVIISIFEGDVVIDMSNKDLPKFLNTVAGKEIVNGNIVIYANDNVDLNVLKTIKAITKNLIINEPSVKDLTFLSSLENVSGDIFITTGKNLKSLSGLEKIKIVKNLYIDGSNEIIDLTFIKNIIVENDLILKYIDIDSFPSFNNIVEIKGSIFLESNSIQVIQCFPNLKSVARSLIIQSNDKIKRLGGLNQLVSVGNQLVIFENNIEQLDGLMNLKEVKNMLAINCPKMKNILNLNKLTSTAIFALGSTQCENLQGLENLENVQAITINGNPKLSDFCTLKPLLIKTGISNVSITNNLLNPTISEIKTNCK